MASEATGRVFRLADALVLLLLLMLPVILLLGAAEGPPIAPTAFFWFLLLLPTFMVAMLYQLPGAFRSPTLHSPYQGRTVTAAAVAVGGTE
jgi:hypothetical protein